MALDENSPHDLYDLGKLNLLKIAGMMPAISSKVLHPDAGSLSDVLAHHAIDPKLLHTPSPQTLTQVQTFVRDVLGKTVGELLERIAKKSGIKMASPAIALKTETELPRIAQVRARYGEARPYPSGSILRSTISFDSVDAGNVASDISEQDIDQAVQKLAIEGISFVMAEYGGQQGSQVVFYLPGNPQKQANWRYLTLESIKEGHSKILNTSAFKGLAGTFAQYRLVPELRKYLDSEVGF